MRKIWQNALLSDSKGLNFLIRFSKQNNRKPDNSACHAIPGISTNRYWVCKATRSFARPVLLSLLMALLSSYSQAGLFTHGLHGDEWVQLADGTAHQTSNNQLQVRVHAWVYEKESRPGALTLFAKFLGIKLDELPPSQRVEFERRVRLLLTDSESNKKILLRFADGNKQALPITNLLGVSQAQLSVAMPNTAPTAGWISYQVDGPTQSFTGRAMMVPETGLSIVSDIDDTIKDSQVLIKRELLLNTFLRPPRAVNGMAALYQNALRTNDTRVHYLSNAPLGLMPTTQEFLQNAGFPAGSIHLRATSVALEVWQQVEQHLLHDNPEGAHKRAVLAQLFSDFPNRRFVLVGDTGEQDPEIYGDLARAYPKQVQCILLRNVTQAKVDDQRMKNVMRQVSAWRLFVDSKELNNNLSCAPTGTGGI